jgi:predicted secreted protein
MNVVSALVLLAVIWFLTLFIVIPIRLETQGDIGERVEGTHAGSPSSSFSMKRKIRITTLVALPIWLAVCAVIIWGGIGVRDIDFFGRMGPPSEKN